MEDFADLGTTVAKKSYLHLGASPMRPNELWTRPDNGAIKAKPMVVNGVVVGPIEEEEEGHALRLRASSLSFT